MRVLFLGSSDFSKVVLEKMLERGVNVTTIITAQDKPSGRGHKLLANVVKTFGQEKGIEVRTYDRIRLHMDEVLTIDYDLAVVASFGQILPDEFLNHRPCINVHPSLLPLYRGPSPIQSALLSGDKVSGVTIMKVASEVDAGDIILQQKLDIEGLYYCEAEEKLALLGGNMIAEVISQMEKGTISFTPQNHSQATFTKKFVKESGRLDFSLPARELYNRVRALSDTTGTYLYLNGEAIKIERVTLSDEKLEIGQISANKKAFIIGCKEGAIEILRCKSPSGKSISGRDYINGHNEILGAKVDNV